MADQTKPVLQKPPGYRSPSAQAFVPPRPPPRKAAVPPVFRPKKKRRNCCRLCCCYTCVIIFILIILVAAACCFLYLWYQPKLPVVQLQSLDFPRFKITSGPDGPALSSQAVIRLEMKNPNTVLGLNYGKTEVDLNAAGVDLGMGRFPEFTQGKKNRTVMKLTAEVKNYLIDNGAARKLGEGFRTKSVVVGTEVRTGIGVRAGGLSTKTVPVKVKCGGLSLKQIEGGAEPKCTINLLKWININV